MLPWEIVDRAAAPGGSELVLARRGEEWVVRVDSKVLMSSRAHGSEDALAALTLERAAKRDSILIGGLGLGFTVRAALDRVPVDARVVVAELSPALVEWNRSKLSHLAGRPLDDRRVQVEIGDVGERLAKARNAFDAIMLDVDNGPTALVDPANERLYGWHGIAACREALRAGGVLGVWSASPDEAYRERLQQAGFSVKQCRVSERGEKGGKRHLVILAVKGGAERTRGEGKRERRQRARSR